MSGQGVLGMKKWFVAAVAFTGLASMANAQVSVPNSFGAGSPISAAQMNENFTALVNAVNNLLPIGTIIASTLTQAQMNTQCNDAGLWLLANGSTAPSTYTLATGQSVLPDLRGRYLRGKNNGAITTSNDLDGDVAIGSYEEDQMQGHAHRWYPDTAAGAPAPSVYAPAGSGFAGSGNDRTAANAPFIGGVVTDPSTSAFGTARIGDETRPKSVVVNYFIKVK